MAVTAVLAQNSSASALEADYTVVPGDTLSHIAERKQTTWQDVWSKNPQLVDPNVIYVGDKLYTVGESPVTAPEAPQEPLVENRAETPVQVETPVVEAPVASQTVEPVASVPVRGNGGHNAYAPGYCTWYVKERRPDIGSFWGNANQWVGSATAAGYSTGSVPVPGAIGVSYTYYLGHVVYVESVNGDGTVNVSEMNYQGHGVVSSRTAPASEFTYIY